MALLAVLVGVFALPLAARAQTVNLDDFVLDNQAGSIMIRFSLSVTEPEHLERALRNGASLALRCVARMCRPRGFWFDASVSGAVYENTITYDALSQEFVLAVAGSEQQSRDKDLRALLRGAWGAVAMDLGSYELLDRGRDYAVDLDVSLKFDDVPQWLRSALFFWNWNAVPTTRYRMEFQY
ncbi:MAG: DUF4390 domain-containing protein [Desulfovibrionaceae bacterium]